MTENESQPVYYIRLNTILKMIPVSKSTWYRGVKSGIYPQPVRISEKVSAWRLDQIQAYLQAFEGKANPSDFPKRPWASGPF